MHRIALAGGEEYACADDDTLLRAALRAGVGLAYECNVGSCGSCKVELVDGDVQDLWPEAPGIKPRERERGRRLACQSVPRGDCTIKARISETNLARHAPERRIVRFEGARTITHDIAEFSFRADAPARFQAGQYALLTLPGQPAARAYSMSNTANDAGLWRFMVRRVPGGRVSNALFDRLTAGAGTIALDGPFGLAYLREETPRDIVCVAGGSGLAPMVAILDAAALHADVQQRAAWLFYGGRGPADVPDVDAVLATHARHGWRERFSFHPTVSVPALAEGTDWGGERGFVHELLPRTLKRPLPDYEYYLAGPPPMIEAATRLLVVDARVPQAQLHFDRFF